MRDQVVDFMNQWSEKTKISLHNMLKWCSLPASKFYNWRDRYGLANEHNGKIHRDYWLEREEKEAIINFFINNPRNGYRRLAFMMIDQDVAYVSPTTVYNVLKREGLIDKSKGKPSKKGTGFVQPLGPHKHWHIDISYINVCGTFYYLCTILDGYSRFIVHFDLKASMKEEDIEILIQRANEKYPGYFPRIISDNGTQFIAKDFKEFIRLSGMDHVRTSPYYPQSNGKLERWHKEMKQVVRARSLTNRDDAFDAVKDFVEYYNNDRLHSAIGYITPLNYLNGHADAIYKERDLKLEQARKIRKEKRAMNLNNLELNLKPEVEEGIGKHFNKQEILLS